MAHPEVPAHRLSNVTIGGVDVTSDVSRVQFLQPLDEDSGSEERVVKWTAEPALTSDESTA